MIVLKTTTAKFICETEDESTLYLSGNLADAKIFTSLDYAFRIKEMVSLQRHFEEPDGEVNVAYYLIHKERFVCQIVELPPGQIDANKILFALIGRPCDVEKVLKKSIGATEFIYRKNYILIKFDSSFSYNRLKIEQIEKDKYLLSLSFFNKIEDYVKYNVSTRNEKKLPVTIENIREQWEKNFPYLKLDK